MTPIVISPVIRKRFTAGEYAPMAAAGVLTENDVVEAGRARAIPQAGLAVEQILG